LRALELENEAVAQSATAAATRTDILQGQYVALDIKIQRARRRIAEMRKRIEEHKANLTKDEDKEKVEGD
jgi:chromosome segregation ATPase